MCWKKTVLLFCLAPLTTFGFDNGPRVVGCDYKFGALFETDKCLITGSGMQMGNLWVAFKVKKSEFLYQSDNPNFLDKIDAKGNVLKSYRVKNLQSQCRPGGIEADKYEFSNGDFICLYD
jgi:hypothetical protein